MEIIEQDGLYGIEIKEWKGKVWVEQSNDVILVSKQSIPALIEALKKYAE
jgi:hypothetical protein